MNMSSMICTMGTALNRAHESQLPVALLVEGQWMQGYVAAIDGHGLVLAREEIDHCVVKLDRVAAVRILAAAPIRDEIRSLSR